MTFSRFFFLMSQGSLNPRIRLLWQKLCPVAHAHTHRQTRKWILSTPFQGFRTFFFNLSSRIGPISNKNNFTLWPISQLFRFTSIHLQGENIIYCTLKWYSSQSRDFTKCVKCQDDIQLIICFGENGLLVASKLQHRKEEKTPYKKWQLTVLTSCTSHFV